MLAKEERRSLASMAAVLITEAIKQRVREGTFTPTEDDPSYANAKRRQVARAIGQRVEREGILDGIDLSGVDAKLVSRKVSNMSTKDVVERLSI